MQQEYIYEEGLDQYEVAMAAFSSQGSWLATVEERGRKLSDLEFSLKLWAFDRKTQRYGSLTGQNYSRLTGSRCDLGTT